MIVKNESKVIERLLESVVTIIDCYCICDTGSTDGTQKIIRDFFDKQSVKQGIPGKIVEAPFVDFAQSRNVALRACQGMSDYVLLLDADMRLRVNTNMVTDKSWLKTGDYFLLLQGNDHFYYENVRIIKNDPAYQYAGVTHEYVSYPDDAKRMTIGKNALFIEDFGDGGAKGDKFERDIRLLEAGLVAEPDNARYMFYLANSFHDTSRFDDAIPMYEKRIAKGGWEQEIWYSHFRIGHCYKKKGDMAQAMYWWWEAYNFLPKRLENIYEMMHFYRCNSKHRLVKVLYDMVKETIASCSSGPGEKEKDSFLFLQNNVYTYKIEYEYMVSAFYNGITTIQDSIVRILNECPETNLIQSTFYNMKFYKDILQAKQVLDYSVSFSKQVADVSVDFVSSSSSILVKRNPKEGYLFNLRCVNYRIHPNGQYYGCENGQGGYKIITTNLFVELNHDLVPATPWHKIFDLVDDGRTYLGVEDVRLWRDPETQRIQFIGNGFHQREKIGVVCGDYTWDKDVLTYEEIESLNPESEVEKNWVFVEIAGATHVVYSWSPLRICNILTRQDGVNPSKHLKLVKEVKEMPEIFRHARGSSCGVRFGNEIWFVVHLVSYEDPRHYYHVFAVFDENMGLQRYSAPFCFEGAPIEYTLGLIVEEDRVIVPYSVWDRETKIAVYDKAYIDESVVRFLR